MTAPRPPRVWVAVVAIIVSAAAFSAAYGFSRPLFLGADELAHLDHAYQIWQGRLPDFYRGIELHPSFGFRAPWQWTSQHPPLYYVLEAPIVGPLLDGGHIAAAGYAARLVSGVTAGAAAAGVMWAARCVAPHRPSFWLTAGIATAANPAIGAVGGLGFNDDIFVATSAAVLGVTALIVRNGVTTARLVALALAATAALLSRSTAALVIGLCGVALVVVVLRRPRPWRHLAGLVAAGVVTTLGAGWFYLHNLRTTGNLLGGHFEIDLPGRHARSLVAALDDPLVWRQWHLIWGQDVVDPDLFATLLVGVPILLSAVLACRWARRRPPETGIVVVGVCLALIVGVVYMQAQYVAHRGGASWRYFMPLVPVISLAVAWTTTAARRVGPPLLVAWLAGTVVPCVLSTRRALAAPTPDGYADVPTFPWAALAALPVAVAALAVATLVVAGHRRREADSRLAPS